MALQETINYSTGIEIFRMLSSQTYKRITGPAVELVKNSLDACAEDIHIRTIKGKIPRITFSDTGDGMDKEKLDGFYRIAGSQKKGVRKNRKGHPMLGNYGVGNLGIYAMGAKHTLETVHEETVRTVSVDFNELEKKPTNWQNIQHPVAVRHDGRRSPGTTIEITELREKYSETHYTKLENALIKSLGRVLKGHLKYAQITVNGRKVESHIETMLRGTTPKKNPYQHKRSLKRKNIQVSSHYMDS